MPTADLIVIAGQSNAMGASPRSVIYPGGTLAGLNAYRQFQRVYIFDSMRRHFTPPSDPVPTYAWQKLKVGTPNTANEDWNDGRGGFEQGQRAANADQYGRGYGMYGSYQREDGFGAEIGIALEHEDLTTTGDVFIYKKAYGGTMIEEWQKGRTGTTAWYNWLKDDFNKAYLALQSLGYTTINLKALYWMQGESNSVGTEQAVYLQLLSQLLSDFQSDVGNFERIIIGKVGTDAVAAAQQQFVAANSNAVLLSADSYTTNDGVHYDAPSQILRGRLVYQSAMSTTSLLANVPSIVVAKTDAPFVDAGITPDNTSKIFLPGSTIKSYVPGSGFNSISSFEAGKGYWIEPKTNFLLPGMVVV